MPSRQKLIDLHSMQNPFEYVSKLQELGAKGAEPAADEGIAGAGAGNK